MANEKFVRELVRQELECSARNAQLTQGLRVASEGLSACAQAADENRPAEVKNLVDATMAGIVRTLTEPLEDAMLRVMEDRNAH